MNKSDYFYPTITWDTLFDWLNSDFPRGNPVRPRIIIENKSNTHHNCWTWDGGLWNSKYSKVKSLKALNGYPEASWPKAWGDFPYRRFLVANLVYSVYHNKAYTFFKAIRPICNNKKCVRPHHLTF